VGSPILQSDTGCLLHVCSSDCCFVADNSRLPALAAQALAAPSSRRPKPSPPKPSPRQALAAPRAQALTTSSPRRSKPSPPQALASPRRPASHKRALQEHKRGPQRSGLLRPLQDPQITSSPRSTNLGEDVQGGRVGGLAARAASARCSEAEGNAPPIPDE